MAILGEARDGDGYDGSVMTESSLWAVGAAFAVSLGLPAVVLPLLRHLDMVDVPNERSAHTEPTVRGGGLAPAAGMTVGLAIAAVFSASVDERVLWLLLTVGTTAACVGLLEDMRGLSRLLRGLGQLAIGVVGGAFASQILDVTSTWAIVGGVALLGGINVVNFMDGVNGISALHGMIAGGGFIALGEIHEVHWMVVAGAVLMAVFSAFLVWNASGRLFLGDVGSYLLGAVVSMIVLLGWMQGLPILALLAPMAIYVADAGVTLGSRIVKGEQWLEAHRDHTYQRLHRRGMSHLAVAGLVALASATCASLGIIASSQDGAVRGATSAGIALVVVGYLALRALGTPDPAHEEVRRQP